MIEFALTDFQVEQVAPLLADPSRVACIGSIHPQPFVPGMPAERIGRLVARVGSVPRERMGAVRRAALGSKRKSACNQ